jgi:hypothetical protein
VPSKARKDWYNVLSMRWKKSALNRKDLVH